MAITGTISKVGDSINVSYSGDIQSYTVPKSGTYKLEVWGGQGGNVTQTNINTLKSGGGKGGYSQGEIVLTAGQILYIGCGGEGTFASFATHTVSTLAGGYNGGGDGGITGGFPWNHRASGGGATHIALGSNRGVLANYESYKSEILIVAGGGGGGSTRKGYGGDGSYYEYLWASGGFGGGIEGGSGAGFTDDGTNNVYSYGTQTEGGHYGTNAGHIAGFGRGLSGGGGGWYGGYGTDSWAAGGGSGYIDGLDKGSTIIGINEGNG